MSLLEQFDADWSNLWPSRPTAKLCLRVTAEGVDMSGLNEDTAVLWTERDVQDTMSCQHSDHRERRHFSNLTLHTTFAHPVFNCLHTRPPSRGKFAIFAEIVLATEISAEKKFCYAAYQPNFDEELAAGKITAKIRLNS